MKKLNYLLVAFFGLGVTMTQAQVQKGSVLIKNANVLTVTKGNLEASDVDVTAVRTDPSRGSGMSVAILQDDGDYGAVIVSGSNLGMDSTLIDQSLKDLGGTRVMVLQNEVPHAVNVAAAKYELSLDVALVRAILCIWLVCLEGHNRTPVGAPS